MKIIKEIRNNQEVPHNTSQHCSLFFLKDSLIFILHQNQKIDQAAQVEFKENQPSSWNFNLQKLISQFEALKQSFQQVNLVFETPNFMFIPEPYFEVSKARQALEYYTQQTLSNIQHHRIPKLGHQVVYDIPFTLEQQLQQQFPQAKRFHQSTLLIMQAEAKTNQGQMMLLKVHLQYFEICAFKGTQWLGYTRFEYKTIDEFMFMLLSFTQSHELKTQETPLFVEGAIIKSSPLYQQIESYFRSLELNEELVGGDIFTSNLKALQHANH
jgi:hypothetical protein